MKGIVFLFDGQGAFKPGVGRELYGKYPPAQKVIDRSSEILGFDLKDHLWGAAAAATSGRTKDIADRLGVKKIHVSISHTKELAVAVVILEG